MVKIEWSVCFKKCRGQFTEVVCLDWPMVASFLLIGCEILEMALVNISNESGLFT